MERVLGIDLGTSYFKLGLFDREGGLCGLGRVAVEARTDDAGRCELPVETFWAALRAGLSQALGEAGAQPADIRALAYSSQANSFLLLDERDEPLTPIVVWTDARAAPVPEEIDALWRRDDFLRATGVGVGGPQLCLAKLAWFRRHEPETWRRMRRVQTLSDYFVHALTGRAVGDEGTACLPGEVQVIGVGPWRFASWPAEVFVEYALRLKQRYKNTYLITCANGESQTYIVTKEAAEKDWYESFNSLFSPEAGEQLLEKTCELLDDLKT